jgi:hypothetical protein
VCPEVVLEPAPASAEGSRRFDGVEIVIEARTGLLQAPPTEEDVAGALAGVTPGRLGDEAWEEQSAADPWLSRARTHSARYFSRLGKP